MGESRDESGSGATAESEERAHDDSAGTRAGAGNDVEEGAEPEQAEPADAEAEHAEPEQAGGEQAVDGRPRPAMSTTVVAIGLAVAGVVLTGAAGFFAYQHNELRAATGNQALLDGPATAEVKEEVSAAVEELLSYDYNAIEETEQAADELLVNDEVRDTYNALYGEVKRVAPEQEMVLTSRVSRLAVIDLDDDEARLLVFVDQSAVRAGEEDGNVGGSQLTVTAQREDDQWKIAGLDTYTDPEQEDPAQQGEQPSPEDGEEPPPEQGGDNQQGGDN